MHHNTECVYLAIPRAMFREGETNLQSVFGIWLCIYASFCVIVVQLRNKCV